MTIKNDEKRDCSFCYGKGTKTETKTETDTASSLLMGTALGIGYMPMSRTVTETVTCIYCGGTGKSRY